MHGDAGCMNKTCKLFSINVTTVLNFLSVTHKQKRIILYMTFSFAFFLEQKINARLKVLSHSMTNKINF